jgi:uncharacterized membrane protein YhhN
MNIGLLLSCSVAASLIFLFANSLSTAEWMVFFKVASTAILALVGFRFNRLLGSALLLGAVGDLLLGIHHLGALGAEKLFLSGLGAFLVGHLAYIAMFYKLRVATNRTLSAKGARFGGIAAVLIALVWVLALLHDSLGPLLIPVVVYAFVLATMAVSALVTELGNPLAAVGAMLFVASDAMLAIAKFSSPFGGSTPLIWITYYMAQLLIFLGVVRSTAVVSRIKSTP